MKPVVPTEDYEGECFALWLETEGYKFSHLAQNTFTRSWSVKAKLKRAGVKRGIPDYLVLLPNLALFIELKRVRGGKLAPEQREWIEALNRIPGCAAHVAKGFEAAKKIVLAEAARPKYNFPILLEK